MKSKLRENTLFIRAIQVLSVIVVLCVIFAIYHVLAHYPIPTTPANRALLYYRQGYFYEAIDELESLPKNKHNQDVKIMLAWSHLRIKQYAKAKALFEEVNQKDPNLEEALIGLAEVALSQQSPEKALTYLNNLKNPSKGSRGSSQLVLADVYYQLGKNVEAAKIYQTLIQKNTEVKTATMRYLAITGFAKYEKGQSLALPQNKRSSEQFIKFRAPERDYIEMKTDKGWQPIFIKGANLTGALPGHFVTETPQDVQPYLAWFEQMGAMHCNTLRIYNRHYPAFYQALKIYNETAKEKIWFIQEIWLEERDPDEEEHKEVYDLYDLSWTEDFYKELRNAVNVVHGNADIPFEAGRSAGIYSADVSQYLLAYGIGREVEPYIIVETNKIHSLINHYEGQFVSLPNGTPVEAWFAEKFDWIAKFEMENYNAQHPLTLVSWGPLDGLHHPSEPSYEDVRKWHSFYGQSLPNLTKKQRAKGTFEANVATIDMTHFKATPQFEAGVFVAFNIYAHWPQFMYAGYQGSFDEWGHNPFFGYLLDLKAHYRNMPLLIGEYGVPTSWSPIIVPQGSFLYGGYSEQGQGEVLQRMSYNIQKSKCAGGLIFEYQDGWWKREVAIYPFLVSERKPYWYNAMDPQEGYGLQGYHTDLPFPQLRGESQDWKKAQTLSKAEGFSFSKAPGDLKKTYAFSDETFLYIRFDVKPWEKPEDLQSNDREYWIGLSTLPGIFGAQLIGDKDFYVEDGINFLIKLNGIHTSQILIAQNYNPVFWFTRTRNSKSELVASYKKLMPVSVELIAPFERIEIPGKMNIPEEKIDPNKDFKVFNAAPIDRSPLHYGTAELSQHQYASLAAWHVDLKKGMIEVRIPWGLLYMMDPSSRLAFGGISKNYQTTAEMEGNPLETPGVGVVVLEIQNNTVKRSLPTSNEKKVIPKGQLPIYQWRRWTMPTYKAYLKDSYYKMQETFKTLDLPH